MSRYNLPFKTILYVPLRDGENNELSKECIKSIIDYSIKRMIDIGGGATIIDGLGYWKNTDEELEEAKTKLLLCYAKDLEEAHRALEELAHYIKQETKSKAICYEINNCLFII